ncbi:MAG: TrmH family RNA methyltransferase [Verrucomicrobia bacterium]|nr:TrmH family RNA methyltransferase [Verrucomicrobiota bacterium]
MNTSPSRNSFTKHKFTNLPLPQQHKKAAEALRTYIDFPSDETLQSYLTIAEWLDLALPSDPPFSLLSDRYHFHLAQAGRCHQEHHFLIQKQDTLSTAPSLPIAVYLHQLRSAFNVGSIIRTTEAFRLGSLYFSSATPFTDNPKVQKASMGAWESVACTQITDLNTLPRPWIALETAINAPTVHDAVFPKSFTLLLGNEEYGLPDELLAQVDACIQIPLVGSKNSLNVASAYAIAAAAIAHQGRRPLLKLLPRHSNG